MLKYFIGIIVIVVLVIIVMPLTIISPGERGIVTRLGSINRVLEPGVHFRTPLIESVKHIDVTTQKEEVEASAASKDLQAVSAKIAVNYNLDPNKVAAIWTEFRDEYQSRVIAPAIQEAVKAATAKYTAEELITKREEVKGVLTENLKARLGSRYILVSEVLITNFDFSEGFNQAIEKKVKAEQDALASKNKLEQIKYEAEQKIATAKADAEAIRLQSDAANNDKYVKLKALEVQLEFAKRWDGKLPVNLYGSAPIPFLQLNGQ